MWVSGDRDGDSEEEVRRASVVTTTSNALAAAAAAAAASPPLELAISRCSIVGAAHRAGRRDLRRTFPQALGASGRAETNHATVEDVATLLRGACRPGESPRGDGLR